MIDFIRPSEPLLVTAEQSREVASFFELSTDGLLSRFSTYVSRADTAERLDLIWTDAELSAKLIVLRVPGERKKSKETAVLLQLPDISPGEPASYSYILSQETLCRESRMSLTELAQQAVDQGAISLATLQYMEYMQIVSFLRAYEEELDYPSMRLPVGMKEAEGLLLMAVDACPQTPGKNYL